MTKNESIFFILSFLLLTILNIMMFKKKKTIENSKYLWLYFIALKFGVILSAFVTIFQIYVFSYKYVEFLRNDMFHNVMFCYIGYLLIIGFMIFMEEHQVRLFVIVSGVLLLYQIGMGIILVFQKEIITILLDDVMNIFRYGDLIGVILAFSGPLLTLYGLLSAIHFLYCNNKVGITA